MTIRSMGAWLWYRLSNAGSSKEVKPVLQVSNGIVRNPEPDMQGKAFWMQGCEDLASKGCISCSKIMCTAHARTCMTCTEGWWCTTCLAAHVGNTCIRTAQGLRPEVRNRIP